MNRDARPHILLLHRDETWNSELIQLLQARGWSTLQTSQLDVLYEPHRYQAYLIDLSYPQLDLHAVNQHIRSLTQGENSSVFLINDGTSSLKTFEGALKVGADGLYFYPAQLSLLLSNFPHKSTQAQREAESDVQHTLRGHHVSSHQASRKLASPESEPSPTTIHNRERVLGISLGHRNLKRVSMSYHGELSVSDVEAALATQEAKKPTSPSSTPASSSEISKPATPLASSVSSLQSSHREPSPEFQLNERLDLSEISFAQIFAHLTLSRHSLTLSISEDLTSAQTSKRTPYRWSIACFEGELIGIEALHLNDLLARHLVAERLISRHEVDRILSELRGSDHSLFVERLFELNDSIVAQLESAVITVAERAFQQLFELTQGEVLTAELRRPEEPLQLKKSSIRLLIDGIQGSYTRLRLYREFMTPKAIPIIERLHLFSGHLTLAEQTLLEDAQGEERLEVLAQRHQIPPLQALGLCYALSLLGELHINDLSPVHEYDRRACTEDYFQLLEIPYDAETDAVLTAWHAKRSWINEQRCDPQILRRVIDVLNDAYCVLAHPPLRTRYLSSLSKPIYSELSVVPQVPLENTQIPKDSVL